MFLVLSLAAMTAFFVYQNQTSDTQGFECLARLRTAVSTDDCRKESVSDVFISLQAGGKGYIIASGAWSCERAPASHVDGIINFSWLKQGEYYSIHTMERNSHLETIFSVLKYQNIKLKKTKLNSSDYILTLPNETLMICTEN